jgi:hypothetical protein
MGEGEYAGADEGYIGGPTIGELDPPCVHHSPLEDDDEEPLLRRSELDLGVTGVKVIPLGLENWYEE